MPEWLIERGIGETRYALIEGGEIIEARIRLDGAIPSGTVLLARLVSVGNGGRNAVARAPEGPEYLLPRGAPGVTEGATLHIEVTREVIPGNEQWKRPLARVSSSVPADAPSQVGRRLAFPAPKDELAGAGWNDLIEEARSGSVRFTGGELRISPTPAMTLIDVDGADPPDELGVGGAAQAARAIRRLDIGGSIGIDLPTTASKKARLQAAEAIDQQLPKPFERTAVNGFGFVQIVRPRARASLLELAQDRAAFEARALLRNMAFQQSGSSTIVAHPAVIAILDSRVEWLEQLALQIGGAIQLRADAALPMSGGYAEKA